MFIEQKALLRSLEEMSGIIESMDRRFMLKALGSFSCRLPAEVQAERLIELTERKKKLLILRLDVFEALNAIKPEYRRILAEKYGFDEEKKGVTDEKNRNYYRKLALSVRKICQSSRRNGRYDGKNSGTRKKFLFFKRSDFHRKSASYRRG